MGTRAFLLLFLASFHALANECVEFEKYRCEDNQTYRIHLTFDDGPHQTNTPTVLDTLDKYQQKATFFVVGENLTTGSKSDILKKKLIMDRMKRSSHLIGSHSFKHVLHTKLDDKVLKTYVLRSKEILKDYLTQPYLFRLPYGDGWHPLTVHKPRAAAVMNELDSQGFIHVGWSLDADDWDRRRQRRPGIFAIMADQICENRGGVVLLHDNQKNTADNLDKWMKGLQCLGHELVPIDEFMHEEYVQRGSHSRVPTGKKGKL